MHLGTPQIIVIVLYILSLGLALGKHGQPRNDKYNFGVTLIATSIMIALLYWGGFFAK